MQKRLLMLFCLFWSVPAFGQVVVPSLDPVFPTELASALAWRVGSTVGVNVEADYQAGDESNDASSENSNNSVMLAYQPGNFVTEFEYKSIAKEKEPNFDDLTVNYNDVNTTSLSLKLAVRGNRRVSLGLGYHRLELEDATSDYLYTSYEGSFSLRLLDGLLYAGGGLQRVTANGSDDSLKYNTLIGGVAIQMGDPLDMMFQAEVSLKRTSATESDNGTFEVLKSTESQLNVECLTGIFFLSYQYKHLIRERVTDDADGTTVLNKFGAGVKLGSLSIGLYRKAWEWGLEGDILKADSYQLTVGYNFI